MHCVKRAKQFYVYALHNTKCAPQLHRKIKRNIENLAIAPHIKISSVYFNNCIEKWKLELNRFCCLVYVATNWERGRGRLYGFVGNLMNNRPLLFGAFQFWYHHQFLLNTFEGFLLVGQIVLLLVAYLWFFPVAVRDFLYSKFWNFPKPSTKTIDQSIRIEH